MNSKTLGQNTSSALEYPRLVRLCAHLTGNIDVAEDLAQETLFVALQHEHELRDPAKRPAWLSGIARNICLMWARKRARESERVIRLCSQHSDMPFEGDDWPASDFDLEQELERSELAALVDKALGLLPPETRAAIIQKYIEGHSLTETAAQLGVNESTAEKRLQRGIQALHRVLTNELIRETASYGLADFESDGWQETPIWCSNCGEYRLIGRFTGLERMLWLRCPRCQGEFWNGRATIKYGVKGFKAAFIRDMAEAHEFWKYGIKDLMLACPACCCSVPFRTGCYQVASEQIHYARANCPTCGYRISGGDLAVFAMSTPEARVFWRDNPKVRRILPEREIESGGVPAVVTSWESLSGSGRLDVVIGRESGVVIHVSRR